MHPAEFRLRVMANEVERATRRAELAEAQIVMLQRAEEEARAKSQVEAAADWAARGADAAALLQCRRHVVRVRSQAVTVWLRCCQRPSAVGDLHSRAGSAAACACADRRLPTLASRT
jgi:hypothetical protein